jgi:hypothetical protein
LGRDLLYILLNKSQLELGVMSRDSHTHSSLPVLCVEIDQWRCAGPLGPKGAASPALHMTDVTGSSLGPSFPSFKGVVNTAGHAMATAVTGGTKDMNVAFNLLNKDVGYITALLRSSNWNLETMKVYLKKAYPDFSTYKTAKEARDP